MICTLHVLCCSAKHPNITAVLPSYIFRGYRRSLSLWEYCCIMWHFRTRTAVGPLASSGFCCCCCCFSLPTTLDFQMLFLKHVLWVLSITQWPKVPVHFLSHYTFRYYPKCLLCVHINTFCSYNGASWNIDPADAWYQSVCICIAV